MKNCTIIFVLSSVLVGCAVPDPAGQDSRGSTSVSISMAKHFYGLEDPVSYVLQLDLSALEGPRPALFYPCVDSQILRTQLVREDVVVPPRPVFSDAGGSPQGALPVYHHGTARFCDERFVRLHSASAIEFRIPLTHDDPERLLFSVYDLSPGEYTLMVSYNLSSAANYRGALDALEYDWGNEVSVFGLSGEIRSNEVSFSVR